MNILLFFIFGISTMIIVCTSMAVLTEDVPFKPFLVAFILYLIFGFWLFGANLQRNRDKSNQVVVYSEIKESEAGLYYKDALGESRLIDKTNSFYFADKNKYVIKIKHRKGGWYNGIYFVPNTSYEKLVDKPKAEKEIL